MKLIAKITLKALHTKGKGVLKIYRTKKHNYKYIYKEKGWTDKATYTKKDIKECEYYKKITKNKSVNFLIASGALEENLINIKLY